MDAPSKSEMAAKEFIHDPLGEEIASIGGRYVLTKEERLEVGGREVLYLVGAGSFDATCCGFGGCAYALVPGYLVEYKSRKSTDGLPISVVTPVTDEAERKEITGAIMKREVINQVNFNA